MSLFTDARYESGTAANGGMSGNGTTHTRNAHDNNGAFGGIGGVPAVGLFEAATPTMYAEYAGAVQRTLNRMPWNQVHAVVEAIVWTWERGGQVLLMGNGGSASTATHLACDLSKNTVQPGLPRVRALALNDNMALMTALANDIGYDAVFAEQVRTIAQPGDLVIAISTSGNSPNVLRAVEVAHTLGLLTVALCGYTGGKICAQVDIAVITPNHCVEQIEDIHMLLAHVVTVGVRGAMQAALVRGAEFEKGAMIAAVLPAANSSGTWSAVAYDSPANGHSTNGSGSNGSGFNGSASNGSGSNGSGSNGSGSNGVRTNGVRPVSYVPSPAVPEYWQNGTALNGHD